ncbi:MAG TPA: hypothetical protein VGG03_25775 [Thermoanaerobaculia bacterium]|jgi:hypothetical protein
MDPLTLIVTALAAGATAAAKETAGQVIKDAYNGLKGLIQKRFAGKPAAEVALAEHEKEPEVWSAPLKKALNEVGATEDETIVKAAQELLKRADPDGAAKGKYNVQFHGPAQGTVIGDRPTVTQTFNNVGETQKRQGSS